MKNLSIYIHIPFCKQKCLYCDFSSFANKNGHFADYINALLNELKNYRNDCKEYSVNSIFIGGGTPSYIPSEYIKMICNVLFENYNISGDAEITIEANPGTLNKEKLVDYYNSGINRLSIGLQSSDDKILKRIGRIHKFSDFEKNFCLAREVGFKNINVDIMFALPNQTLKDLENTLSIVTGYFPEHISCYSLIIEDNTELKKMYDKGIYKILDEETDRKMYYTVNEFLKSNSYHRYEISNFAKKDFECYHNKVYWKCEEYLGFGISAHSDFKNIRFNNTYDIDEYILKNGVQIRKDFLNYNKQDRQSEFMFMGLRMMEGVSDKNFKKHFGESFFGIYGKQISYLLENGLIKKDDENIRLTDRGIDISNTVFLKFL